MGRVSMDFERLVKKAKKGDEQAFYDLMLNVRDPLYRIAFRYFGNENDALDALQEVTYKAYIKMGKLRKANRFKAWIFKIMINHCNDIWNKRKRTIPVEQIIDNHGKHDSYQYIILQDLLTSLDPNLQEVIQLKYFEDWTIKQIASWKRVPEGTVKTWLKRSLIMLKMEWEKGDERYG